MDERDNIYVIDFSETRPRNIVSDFARLEPIVKFEQVPIQSSDDLRRPLLFEQGLVSGPRSTRCRRTSIQARIRPWTRPTR